MPVELLEEIMDGQIFFIDGYEFRVTCSACPEQYNVFSESGKYIAYIRCRHGFLGAWLTLPPDESGHVSIDWQKGPIYKEEYEDKLAESIQNRAETLEKIVKAINENLKY